MLLHRVIFSFFQIKFHVLGKYTSSKFSLKRLLWQIKRNDTNVKLL